MQTGLLDGQTFIVSLSDGRSLVFSMDQLLTLTPIDEGCSDGKEAVAEKKGKSHEDKSTELSAVSTGGDDFQLEQYKTLRREIETNTEDIAHSSAIR